MNDDYLWDGSGEPDPEVQRLERLLGRLRSDRPAPELPENRPAWFRWAPAAAAVVLAGFSTWIATRGVTASWQVVVGSDRNRSVGRLEVGESLVTDEKTRAKLSIAHIGVVEIEPNTRLRLVKARLTEHRIALDRGVIHASIWAPPRLFFVDTPSAVAVDLGCAYSLNVDDQGAGLLQVTTGWVGFERDGRESFIPAGAHCKTRPGIGPGTPYFPEASEAFREALDRLDFENGGTRELDMVLLQARKQDMLTLWHLLRRVEGVERVRLYDRMAVLAPPPKGVTREGVLSGDRRMLDRWWDELGLGQTSFWRLWKAPFPSTVR
jgi:hypothetical protein